MNRKIFEKELDDGREKVFLAYRLGDDKSEYVNKVVNTLREKEKEHSAIVVFIAFVEGIPFDYAKEVVNAVAVSIEKEIDTDAVKIKIKPYVDISIRVIRQLEGKREPSQNER